MPLGWGNQGRHAGTMGQIPQEKHQGQLPGAGILLLYTSGARQKWARLHWERINRTPGLRSMELCLPACPLRELSQHEPQLHTARHNLARRAAAPGASPDVCRLCVQLEQTPLYRGPRTPLCLENGTVQRSFPRAPCQPRTSWVLELLSVGHCWALPERTDQLPQSPSCSRWPTPATCLTVACFLVIS